MKKLILSAVAALGLFTSSQAITVTTTLQPGAFTNLVNIFDGVAYVKQVILVSTSTNTASVQIIDTPTNTLGYIVPPYTNIVSFATNVPIIWMNYFGRTNSYTNIALVDLTNSVSSVSNAYPLVLTMSTPTNGSSIVGSPYFVNLRFINGIWATNTTPGNSPCTISVIYAQ